MEILLGALVVIGLIAWYAYATANASKNWWKNEWHKDDIAYEQKMRKKWEDGGKK